MKIQSNEETCQRCTQENTDWPNHRKIDVHCDDAKWKIWWRLLMKDFLFQSPAFGDTTGVHFFFILDVVAAVNQIPPWERQSRSGWNWFYPFLFIGNCDFIKSLLFYWFYSEFFFSFCTHTPYSPLASSQCQPSKYIHPNNYHPRECLMSSSESGKKS